MDRQEARAKGHARKAPFNILYEALADATPNILHWGQVADADAVEVRFRHRGPSDWLAIAKRFGADGEPQVLFGTGYDFLSCVLGLNGAMAGDRWRADRPYQPGKNGVGEDE